MTSTEPLENLRRTGKLQRERPGFLGYFMVRKVMAGKETLRAAGTVTKKLARWLEEKGHCSAADAELGVEAGAEAATSLPQAEELAQALHELTRWRTSDDDEDVTEDHFTLTRVESGKSGSRE